ncbi:MAG: DUF2478 domain-containing protein [Pirellulales bacterium]|nr:DUF2478 domain-containing protein [Pirellulales bacterium]
MAVVVLWVGPKQSGKTREATRLVHYARDAGHSTAGILTPSLHRNGSLAGYDVLDISSGDRVPFARRDGRGVRRAGRLDFERGGLRLGRKAFGSEAARQASLIVVDEFGPLELDGRGWRPIIEQLFNEAQGVVLLVVREELAARVAELLWDRTPRILPATQPDSIQTVLDLLPSE